MILSRKSDARRVPSELAWYNLRYLEEREGNWKSNNFSRRTKDGINSRYTGIGRSPRSRHAFSSSLPTSTCLNELAQRKGPKRPTWTWVRNIVNFLYSRIWPTVNVEESFGWRIWSIPGRSDTYSIVKAVPLSKSDPTSNLISSFSLQKKCIGLVLRTFSEMYGYDVAALTLMWFGAELEYDVFSWTWFLTSTYLLKLSLHFFRFNRGRGG